MADRTDPLPSLKKALAAVKPNLATLKNPQVDLSGPWHRNHEVEDHHGEHKCAVEHAQMTREPQENLLIHGEECAGPICLVSFTGFRDEDEWRENDNQINDAFHDPLVHTAGGDATTCADSLSVCKKLVSVLPAVRVESRLTSVTTVLVARRGFTKKRLLAAQQGIPVVLPKWVVMGCPSLLPRGDSCGASAAASASSHDLYAVPWLYGYAFSTTGLSTSEKAAIESVCTAHGAVVEPSLTYKCDVLLANAECVQALQRLLNADRAGDAAQRCLNQLRCHEEVQRTDAGLMENSGPEVAALGRCASASKAAWLTDKVRFALELDVPVVDYAKLFTMLRLDRLPSPTWTQGIEAVSKSSSRMRRPCGDDVKDSQRQYADALSGSDFDEIVEVCRVGAPAGGSAEWTRILSVFTNPSEASIVGVGLQGDGGAADDGREGKTSPPLDGVVLRANSMQSSASFTDSASTVSDPDAWEELLSCALASSLDEQRTRHVDAYPGASCSTGATGAADHLTDATPTTTVLPPLQAAVERLTVNTVDVEDLADAGTDEPSTLQVALPDYYSAATGSELPPHSSSQGSHAHREMLAATVDTSGSISAVDPSPRWTTNALLHAEPAQRCDSRRTKGPLACAQSDGEEAAALRQRTAAYYTIQRTFEHFPPQHVTVMRPGERATSLSQARVDAEETLSATQNLVESFVAADALEKTSVQHFDSCRRRTHRNTAARQGLPLLAMHPPFLTICVLGCTQMELRQTARWCEQCRILRSPVPTSTTDIVVLGSRILTRRRYTMRSAVDSGKDERTAKGGTRRRQQEPARHRKALPSRSCGDNQHRRDHAGHGVAVTIRYWEMDAAVVQTLADVCGIPRSRMVPLKWLEDAASEARKACEAAKHAVDSEGARQSTVHALTVNGKESCTDTCGTAATTPPETLVGLLEEQLAAAADSEASAALPQQPLFHPLPPLPPDQLPDMADIKYYIRVRQAHAISWAGNATPVAAQGPRGSPAGLASAGWEAQKWAKRSEMNDSAQKALGNFSKQPASGRAPVEKNDSLTAALAPSALSVSAATKSTVQKHLHEKKTSLSTTDAEHSYNEELETAGRRFTQLVALFRVFGDDNNAQGSSRAAEVSQDECAKALSAFHFCCVEGEYARVDWAVVRGLIRYGGGCVEKRSAHDWRAFLQKQHPPVAVSAASSDVQQDQQAQRFAHALRRSVDYAKLRQKLLRLAGDVEGAHLTNRQSRDGGTSDCNGAVGADAEAEPANAAEVARITAKLQRLSHLCQKAPVLCLLPHSFQRAAGDESGMARAADATIRQRKGVTGRAAAERASPHKRFHALHSLPAVTMDYVLACVAVGYGLDPHSCFLFDTSIPSAPDTRLLHHQRQQRGGGGASSQKAWTRHMGTRQSRDISGNIAPEGNDDRAGQQPHAGTVATGNSCARQARAPPYRPALSSWVLQRRYSKTNSVGVCVSVLWKLPMPPASEGERCWSRVDTAFPPGTTATIEPRLTPDASLVPLLRVLLLGLRNAVEALGGHVVDTFSPSAVTHVVSVDVDGILSRTLGDAFTDDVVSKTNTVAGNSDGGRPFPYWPMESIESVGRCAARDEVSLVGLEWLAACVEWGAFVDEAGYTPPPDLLARLKVEKQKTLLASDHAARTAVHRRAAQMQRLSSLSQSPNHCRLSKHRDYVAAPSPANTTHPGSLISPATRLPPDLQEHCKQTGIPPRGVPESEEPHTPPHPRLLDYGPLPDNDDSETKEHHAHHTPVRRHASATSTAGCDSGVEPCTPPARCALPQANAVLHSQQSPPPQPLSSPVPPPPRRTSPSGPHSKSQSMAFRACSTGPPSAGSHGQHRQHRRRHSSSASQHNTRSLLQQQDAEAYVEHLGNLFNFFSPGSTPLPSSAHRWRERSITTHADPDAGTPKWLRNPLLQHTPSQSHPPNVTCSPCAVHPSCELTRKRGASSMTSSAQCTEVLTPSKTGATLQMTAAETKGSTVSTSHVLSTPQRRTLRGAAAATAVYTPSATERINLSSPDRQRRRTGDVAINMSSSVAPSQRWKARTAFVDGPRDGASAAPGASAPPPPRPALPNLLGGSAELSRDGTVAEKANHVIITTAISDEEADAEQRQPQGDSRTRSLYDAQTPNGLAKGMGPRSSGMGTGTAQQDANHACVQVKLDGPHLSVPAAFSWMHDVIPDSQQQHQDIEVAAYTDAELMSGDVLVEASFVAATAKAYRPTLAATAETADGSGHCKDAVTPLLTRDGEEAGHKDDTKGVSPPPDVIGAVSGPPIPTSPTTTGTTRLEGKAVRPRLGSSSAPRRPSPPPYPPPQTTMIDVCGGVSTFAHTTEAKQRCGAQCAYTDSNVQGLSPWSRHRPLSLSRRPSRSPAPALSPSCTESTSLVADAAITIVPRAAETTAYTSECLRIYVLHDLPHREVRVRRCEEALKALIDRCDGVEQRLHIGVGLLTAAPPARGDGHLDTIDVNSDTSLPLSAPKPAPPVCFVARCEDADVLVTHHISLRESVLVAVVAGCWVVRPGFLECMVAVLDGACCWNDKNGTSGLMRDPSPTLQLQPQRCLALSSAAAAAMKASELCVARLRKALPTYEWTSEALPCVPASGCPHESGSVLPVQRALVQQCRRQRRMREQAAGRSVASWDAGQSLASSRPCQRLFAKKSFLLLSSTLAANVFPARGTRTTDAGVPDEEPHAATSSRMRSIQRILESGGGCLCCCVQVGCAAADKGEKADKINEFVATSPHLPLTVPRPLRCCVCVRTLHEQGHRLLRRSLAHSSPLVMDADLYHDLLWLICSQIRQNASETLYVLFDGSLLRTNADDDYGNIVVHMSLAPRTTVTGGAAATAACSGEDVDNADQLATTHLPGHDRILKKRRTENLESHDSAWSTAESASEAATIEAGVLAFPRTCTVASWISSWMLPSPDGVGLSKAGDGPQSSHPGYAPAAAHAMRDHLRACCAAVSVANDEVRALSIARVSYDVAEVPFAVPTVAEVRQACTNMDDGTHAGSVVSASCGSVRRIEFRSTTWVGACVAAGGAAVMAAATDGWMRECETHTLLGTLLLE
ncbi:hypothetical protein, conserved [Leishmania tarentolae]|uniref:BRCT domain-containing protein n=1 Tax=Leishmania tarentolae TaxID=5689 RepID=A0A640KKA8_LEITA|nr:hypothetical protein, conserved [Leishmania tarentolae]